MTDYVTVRVPLEIKDMFEQTNKELKLGYTSFAEFVKDAVRKRIEEVRQNYFLGEKQVRIPNDFLPEFQSMSDQFELSHRWAGNAPEFILKIMKKLEEIHGASIEHNIIVQQAISQGMSKEWIEKTIKKLLDNGIIFSPRKGMLTRVT